MNKAIQRYDLPKSCPSLSPDPDMMQDILVRTPSPSPARKLRYVSLDGVPSVEFHWKFDELCKSLMASSAISANVPYLTRLAPRIGQQLLTRRDDSEPVGPSLKVQSLSEMGEVLSQKLQTLPFPLSQPNFSSSVDTCIWIIKFIVIGCANRFLLSYRDEYMLLLVEEVSTSNLLDEFLAIAREYDIYVVVEKILELQTSTTAYFGSQALLSSVANEDEALFELLLGSRVHLDGFRNSEELEYHNVCALHLAVHRQNRKFINGLLERGIDPDGYIDEEDDANLRPLTYLLELYSVREVVSVVHISIPVLSMILEAQMKTYTIERCERNVTLLFLRAWCRDAAIFLEALTTHCQGLTAAVLQSALCLKLIARGDSATKTVHNILQIKPQFYSRGPFRGLLRDMILFRATRINHLPILLPFSLDENSRVSSLPSGLEMDSSTVQGLLDAGIILTDPKDLLLILISPLAIGDLFLCELVLNAFQNHQALSFDKEIDDPLCDAEKRFLSTVIRSEDQVLVSYLMEQLTGDKIWPWSDFLKAAFRFEGLDDCQKLTRIYQNSGSDNEQKSTFWKIFELLTDPTVYNMGHRKSKLALLMSIFDSQLWGSSVAPNTFNHHCQWDLLQVAVDAGLPFNKELLLSFRTGEIFYGLPIETTEGAETRMQALLRLLQKKPTLLTQLTESEALSALKQCMATEHPDRRLLLERFKSVRAVISQRHCVDLILNNSTLCNLLRGNWSCPKCPSLEKCTRIISVAVHLGDIELLRILISHGFVVSNRTDCLALVPLEIAVEDQRIDMVQFLLQAGADVNAPPTIGGVHILEAAVSLSTFKIVQTLLEAGAVVCNRTLGYEALTAIERATRSGFLDILCLLITNSPVSHQLRHECKRAAMIARHRHDYSIARLLECRVEIIEGETGRDRVDDAIENLCRCQLERKDFMDICIGCESVYSTERSWWASLIYSTHALPELNGFSKRISKLEAELTESQSFEEIKELLEEHFPDELDLEEDFQWD